MCTCCMPTTISSAIRIRLRAGGRPEPKPTRARTPGLHHRRVCRPAGCPASRRGGRDVRTETVLVEDWCQQFPSHSVGNVAFGADGALYASAGDGANFTFDADYGQHGGTLPTGGPYVTPRNPCGDPPGGVGGAMTIPTAQGGALRAQDIRTRGPSDPVGLNGSIIRIDPDTGAAWPANANVVIPKRMRDGSSPTAFATRSASHSIPLAACGSGTSARHGGKRSTSSTTRRQHRATSAGRAARGSG